MPCRKAGHFPTAILTSIIGGDSMKKSLIRWSLVVILALLAVIGGPIIINECYKGDSGYIAIWSAADTLSYYGTVLGALVRPQQ